jgi:hypothetical protein
VRPPTRKLKTTYKATRPNLFMWSGKGSLTQCFVF